MKHIAVSGDDPAYALYFDQTATPNPGAGKALVKVKAFGVNRADLLQRKGKYPPPKGASNILGLECSGIVEKCGEGVEGWKPGDEVAGLVDGGAYAEYCIMDEGLIWKKPVKLSFAQAAAIPEVYLTAYQALHWIGTVNTAKKILIHAAASGVGLAALQIAKLEKDLEIYGTSSTGKVSFCENAGYDCVIDYTRDDFARIIEQNTSGNGVDLIVDFIGAGYFKRNIQSLSVDGSLILLAVLGGFKIDEVNLLPILSKRLKIQGSTLRSRDLKYKRKLVEHFTKNLAGRFEKGHFNPVIYKILPWTDISEAHGIMENNKNIGKLVMEIL